mgnify:CR=1 FL=1
MTDIREYLAHKPLLFDGGMGTCYKAAPGADCEMANLTDLSLIHISEPTRRS